MLKHVVKRILPKGSLPYRTTKKIALRTGLLPLPPIDARYQEWIESAEPLVWTGPQDLNYTPLISIVVPVFNPPEAYLKEAVYSVVNQSYDNWELILINASSDAECREYTKKCQQIDTRIKVVNIKKNLGIAGNTNEGLKACQGEYIGLLDHDDVLAPAALYEVAVALQARVRPQFLYSDEDKLTARSGQRYDAHFKPGWSVHLMRQVNYFNHFTVIQKALIDKVKGYRQGFDGAQDYDFYLRLIDERPVIHHIPKVLYHWRAAETSTAMDFSKKAHILEAGIQALQDHLQRNRLKGVVTSIKGQPGYYEIKYKQPKDETVAVLILQADSANQYAEYVRRVVKRNFSKTKGIEVYVNNLKANQKFLSQHEAFLHNIQDKNDNDFVAKVLAQTGAKTLVLIDAAVFPKNKRWVEELSGLVTQCEDVALAVPLLVDEQAGTIADAGIVTMTSSKTPLFQGYWINSHTPFGSSLWTRHLEATSGRVIAMSRKVADTYLLSSKMSMSGMCKKIIDDGLHIVVRPQTIFSYHGDLKLKSANRTTFSPSLASIRHEFGYPKLMRSDRSGDDNA